MNISKTFRALFGSVLFLSASAISGAEPVMLDRIYAIAGGEVVLQSSYERELAVMTEQMKEAPPEARLEEEELQEVVLDRLVLQSLQYQMAERNGIRKSDEDINARLGEIAEQAGIRESRLVDRYIEQGWDYVNLRESIRRQLMIEELQQSMVYQLIKLSDQEIQDYLRSPEGIATIGPEYRIGYIRLPLGGDSEAARSRAEDLRKRALDGADFAGLARRAGMEGNSWDLGWRRISEVPTRFVRVVPELDRGETAELIEAGDALHLIKLIARRGPGEVWEDQVRVRHILVEPGKIRNFDQARLLADELFGRIKAGEDMAELARAYSGDPGSVLSGGLLEWQNPEVYAKEFRLAVEKAELNELVGPVQTEFGWHVLRVEGTRIEDISRQQRENLAVQALFGRRYEEALDKWLKEMREDAFVKLVEDKPDAEEEGMPGEGMPGEGMPGEGMPGEGMPGEGMPGEGMPAEGVPGEAMSDAGMPAEGMPAEGMPAEGMPAEAMSEAGAAPGGESAPRR
ncbi:MAG: peptidylprolyl isomerase [Gammaproteobacteria bacterium AqS3]|nr:peptidylprolyl isomerase [Gammaproteobacteria bacterium AqS3]